MFVYKKKIWHALDSKPFFIFFRSGIQNVWVKCPAAAWPPFQFQRFSSSWADQKQKQLALTENTFFAFPLFHPLHTQFFNTGIYLLTKGSSVLDVAILEQKWFKIISNFLSFIVHFFSRYSPSFYYWKKSVQNWFYGWNICLNFSNLSWTVLWF